MDSDPGRWRLAQIWPVLALFAVFLVSALSAQSTRVNKQPERAPGDRVALVLDDGSAEADWEPLLLEHYLLNRFSPSEFPILLEEISVFVPEIAQVPLTLKVAVFQDIDADPQNGAQLVATVELQSISVE